MTEIAPADRPKEPSGDPVHDHIRAGFDLLANETRLGILLALWDAYEPHAETTGVSFSELRERVGVPDSGQFNYHLGKLKGHFVAATDDGYTLSPIGKQLVQTVIAGMGSEATLPPTELDIPCHRCGSETMLAYEGGSLYYYCPACDRIPDESGIFREPFPAAGLMSRTPEEVFAAGIFQLIQVITMKAGGLCPRCSSVISADVVVCDEHAPEAPDPCPSCGRVRDPLVQWTCTTCKYEGSSTPRTLAALHPAGIAFYHDHGVDIGYPVNDFETSKTALSLIQDADHVMKSRDPFRVEVTLRCAAEELTLTLDEDMQTID